jgi:hypothetical protein
MHGSSPDEHGAPPAPEFLYRFRSVKRLLQGHELENQEIYFASPPELNDPMEGFRDLFWQGDRIAWENLFKHYLRCLNQAFALYVLAGESEPIVWQHIPIVGPLPRDPGSPLDDQLLQEIFDDFLGEPVVQELVAALAGRAAPVRRDELRAYVHCLHPFGLATIWRRHELHRSRSQESAAVGFMEHARAMLPALEAMIRTLPPASPRADDEALLREMFALFDQMSGQLGLIQLLGHADDHHPNKDFVFRTFGEEFVDELEQLVYPDWRVACFMSDCRNSSLWGTYGDSHGGACLIFRADIADDRAWLPLKRVSGYSTSGPIRRVVRHEFHPVQYSNKFPAVDFFRSIGRLPMDTLSKHWHSNAIGERSACAPAYDSAWRDEYWKSFYPGATTKLADWTHEKEFRLLLMSSLTDFSRPEDRKANYDFANLHGVIFGMKMRVEDKLAICRIVAEKCRASGRTDFDFYEAYYSEGRGTIDHRKMNMLRLTEG